MRLDVEIVKELLPSYGYTPKTEDNALIAFVADRAVRRVEDYLNRKDIPQHLDGEIIRIAIGEFLYTKKLAGGLDPDNMDLKFPSKITQLTEGDTSTSITMGGKNDEERYNDLLDEMRRIDPYIFEHYRKVHW